jgi:ATP-dependent protease HslVU (ClpYQ) peptidase subunit
MTTVIMATCFDRSAGEEEPATPYIIACCDDELSSGYTSTVFWLSKIQKIRMLSPWLIGFAGDPAHFTPIRERMQHAMHTLENEAMERQRPTAKPGDTVRLPTGREVVNALHATFKEYRAHVIHERFLERLGVKDATELVRYGEAGGNIISEIHDFDLDITVMIAGFGDSGAIRLVTIADKEGLKNRYVGPQAFAIGSGRYLAFAHLSALYRYDLPLRKAVCRVLEAKFVSEAAQEVGRGTQLVVMDRIGNGQWLEPDSIERVRAIFQKRRQSFSDKMLRSLEFGPKSL